MAAASGLVIRYFSTCHFVTQYRHEIYALAGDANDYVLLVYTSMIVHIFMTIYLIFQVFNILSDAYIRAIALAKERWGISF